MKRGKNVVRNRVYRVSRSSNRGSSVDDRAMRTQAASSAGTRRNSCRVAQRGRCTDGRGNSSTTVSSDSRGSTCSNPGGGRGGTPRFSTPSSSSPPQLSSLCYPAILFVLDSHPHFSRKENWKISVLESRRPFPPRGLHRTKDSSETKEGEMNQLTSDDVETDRTSSMLLVHTHTYTYTGTRTTPNCVARMTLHAERSMILLDLSDGENSSHRWMRNGNQNGSRIGESSSPFWKESRNSSSLSSTPLLYSQKELETCHRNKTKSIPKFREATPVIIRCHRFVFPAKNGGRPST